MYTNTTILTQTASQVGVPQLRSDLKSHQVISTRQQSLISPTQPSSSRRQLLIASTLSLPLFNALPSLAAPSTATLEGAAPDVFTATAPSVVAIGTLVKDSFTAIASGVVWTSMGHVVTAYSPVNTAVRQNQNLVLAVQRPQSSGAISFYPVTAISAREPSLDLMVLQADLEEESSFSQLTLANSVGLKVGQDVFLLGSTVDGQRTLSTGVLSALGRTIPAPNGQAIRGALQTDVDITSLGLGGALVDSSGHLLGIPTVSYSKPGTGRSSGVNFAVPCNVLLDAVPKLIAYGNLAGRR